MNQSDTKCSSVSFIHQLMENKFLLLTTFLAISAAVYFAVGMFMMLRQ
jgi:hypothetical protein